MTTIILTGAGGSAAQNFADALRLGDTVDFIVGADASATKLHLSSADHRHLIPLVHDGGWTDAIAELVRRFGADMVHVQPDPEVLALGRGRDEVGAATFLPTQGALETAADKAAFAAAMDASDVPVPHSVGFADEAGMRSAVAEMLGSHERVWIRARVGAGARGSLPVSSVDQAAAWISWWVEEKQMSVTDFMAAEQLPGREFAYQSVWQDGHLVVGQARERVEYLYGHLTPHGQTSTPSVARTVREERVDALAQAAIVALDPQPNGVYCVDIKEDSAGLPRVTEINAGRFFTTSNFFAHAGVNMPDMVVRAALGEQLEVLGSSPLEPDLYWIRMVDMGHVLVPGDELDRWPRAGE